MPLIISTPYLSSSPTFPTLPELVSTTLLHFDGTVNSTTFTDEKSNLAFAVAPAPYGSYAGAKLSAGAKFGNTCLYLENGGSYITAPAKEVFGKADFTLDFWFNTWSIGNYGDTTFMFTAGSTMWIYLTPKKANGKYDLGMYLYSSKGVAIVNGIVAVDAISGDTWHHLMLTRTGDVYSIYVGGIRTVQIIAGANAELATISGAITLAWRPGDQIPTGGGPGLRPFVGRIDELRIVNGISATSASSFEVPSAPYTT